MGLKLSRKIRSLKNKILDQIENYRIPERFNKEQVKNSTRELLKEKLVIFD